MDKHPMTHFGAEALEVELEQLKRVERPRIIAAIAEAREHGDLKENAEYHAAREEQGFAEGRIKELEAKLSAAQVIDVRKMENTGKVIFGSTVTVENIDTEEETVWMIVGEDEADLTHGKISYVSPVARALIGKEEGDEASVQAPGGETIYEIIKVEYL